MRTYKNTIVRRLSSFCVRDAVDPVWQLLCIPIQGGVGGQGTEAGLPGWLKLPGNSHLRCQWIQQTL